MLLILGFLLLLAALVAGISGAPWVPARRRDIAPLQKELKLKLKPGSRVYELGCGEGRLVKALSQQGYRVTGYEINPLLWLIAYLRCFGLKNVQVKLGDLWKADLRQTDAVVAFLVPRTMPRLESKAQKEMIKGSVLVSYVFELPNKKAAKHIKPWWFYEF